VKLGMARIEPNSNRGCRVLQRLKYGDQDLRCSLTIQVDARTTPG
jgi:hypothetical protein